MAIKIQFRRDIEANWISENPILAEGEMALSTDVNKFKLGNGADVWTDLPYILSWRRRSDSVSSSATPTIDTDMVDIFLVTALATNITSFTTNLSGTPVEGQLLWISITATASRTLAWGAGFENSSLTLPSATDGTNRMDCGFVWNSVTNKWRIVAIV